MYTLLYPGQGYKWLTELAFSPRSNPLPKLFISSEHYIVHSTKHKILDASVYFTVYCNVPYARGLL